MTKDPKLALTSAVIAGLTICLWGCRQAATVPGSLPHHQSSWLSRIPFPKPKGEKRNVAAQSSPPREQSSWLAKMPLMKPKGESPATVTAEQKVNVQMAMARSLEEQGQIDQAITVYLNVVRNDDRRADAYHRLAVLHDRQGRSDKSTEYYREALKRDPQNAALHSDLGYSYYLQRRWSEAESSFRRSLALDPRSARAHNNLALLLAQTERPQEALSEFARAGSTEADARVNLAFAMMLQQQWEEARGQFELALAADPSSSRAQDGLKTVRSLRALPKQQDRASHTASRDRRTVHVGFLSPPRAPLPR